MSLLVTDGYRSMSSWMQEKKLRRGRLPSRRRGRSLRVMRGTSGITFLPSRPQQRLDRLMRNRRSAVRKERSEEGTLQGHLSFRATVDGEGELPLLSDLREGEQPPTQHHSGMAEVVDVGHVNAGSAVKASTESALTHPASRDHFKAKEQLHGIEMHAKHGGVTSSGFAGAEQVPIDTNMDMDEGRAIYLP